MEFLQAIEQLGPVRLLKSSFLAYPAVNALHIAAIGALFTSVLLMDLAVLGAIRSVPREKFVALLRRVALADTLPEHPLWGRMSRGMTGRYVWRHTDHHLRQFGA